jgi:hypothetical protein
MKLKRLLMATVALATLAGAAPALAQSSADCKQFEAPLATLADDFDALVTGIQSMLPDAVEAEGATGSVDLNALEEELKQLLFPEAAVPLTDFAGAAAVLLPRLIEARDLAKTASTAMSTCAANAP